jgi:hypothetical protein
MSGTTTTSSSPATAATPPLTPRSTTAWRIAGGLGLAHVALLLGAFAVEGVASVEHGTAAATVLSTYRSVGVDRVFFASYVEAASFLPLLACLAVLARLLSRRTETGRVAAQTAFGLGVAYVASTFAIGFPPLTTAVYAAHHGLDAGTVATINDLRNLGFVLQIALSMAAVLALGVAALAERQLRRWVGWGGVAAGAVGVVATPFVPNAMSALWMVWWVGLCVLALKGGPESA